MDEAEDARLFAKNKKTHKGVILPLCVFLCEKNCMCLIILFGHRYPSAARLRGCEAARLRGCEAARLRGCEAANFARYAVLCQVLLQNFFHFFCENVYICYRYVCPSLRNNIARFPENFQLLGKGFKIFYAEGLIPDVLRLRFLHRGC